MANLSILKELALSFPEVTEEPHFDKISFRIKKKIFATADIANNRACLKLSVIDQSVFSAFDNEAIYAVPNKWGLQGWTIIELGKIKKNMLNEALTSAYCEVAPKKLSQLVKPR